MEERKQETTMPKSKGKPTLSGQQNLFSSFRRQAQAHQASTAAKSNNKPPSLWENAENENPFTKRKRSDERLVSNSGKGNTKKAPARETTNHNDDDDQDDVPLASLAQRPTALLNRHPKSIKIKKAKQDTKQPTSNRSRGKVSKSNLKQGSRSNSNPSTKTSETKVTSNIDMALQFLQPLRKDSKDLSIKDIQARLSKKPRKQPKQEKNQEEANLNTSIIYSEQVSENDNQTEIKAEEGQSDPADFDASHQSIQRSRNVVHQLLDRSLLGSRGRRIFDGSRAAQSLLIQRPPVQAKHASWISLGRRLNGTHNQTIRVDCMAWCPMGFLLAVAQTCNITRESWIALYDWDTVCAADRKGRNARARALALNQKARFGLDVPPMLQFRIPTSSSSSGLAKKAPWIQWNPFHSDQLAVASRCGKVVYCINVSHVEEALAAAPLDRILKPPRHAYWEFTDAAMTSNDGSTATACRFLDKDHIAIGFVASLTCYRYYPKRDPTSLNSKLMWQYSFAFKKAGLNRASLVSLENLGKEHIVAGSSHGHLALIQWKRVVAASATSAFSTAASSNRSSPTLVSQWLSYASLNDQRIPQEQKQDPSIMGIQSIQVEPIDPAAISLTKKGATPQSPYEQLCGRFRIQWVTRCGWVLKLVLEASPSNEWKGYKVRREKPRIVYQTSPVQTKLATGGSVTTAGFEWSLPTEELASDAGGQFLCWQNVASVTRILPHHDKRVLDDQPSIVRDVQQSNHLLLLFRSGASSWVRGRTSPSSIALPRRRGLPKLVAVDPVNHEWIVVATSEGHLYVVNLR